MPTITSTPATTQSDETLYQKCRLYGRQSKHWRQKFLGLLPEVHRRRLYERKGFTSIFEFAKKLAGASEEQVRLVLNLERKFEKTPILQTLLVSGEVSANKLVRLASIANQQNQEILANQARLLSKSALETLVRDEKHAAANAYLSSPAFTKFTNPNSSPKPLFELKSMPGQTSTSINADLQLLQKLPAELKSRLHQIAEKGIDLSQLLTDLLDSHEQQIETRKAELAEKELNKSPKTADPSGRTTQPVNLRPSHHISVAIKKVLQQEFGTKCAIPTCHKPASQIHHTQRFALHASHDPRLLLPLCADHHQIEHAVDQKYWEKRRQSLV